MRALLITEVCTALSPSALKGFAELRQGRFPEVDSSFGVAFFFFEKQFIRNKRKRNPPLLDWMDLKIMLDFPPNLVVKSRYSRVP